MATHIIPLKAGQRCRCAFDISPSGSYEKAGAVCVGARHVPMQVVGDELIAEAMPPGLHLFEVRVGGVSVGYGYFEVAPSPLADAGGEVAATFSGDVSAPVAKFTLSLNAGPQGEKGDPGPQGEKGEPGEKGDPLTFADLTEEQKAELIAPLGYEEVEVAPEGGTENDYNAYGFGFVMPRGGRVTGLTLACRSSGTATPADTPMWLKAWRGTTLVARSAESQQHTVDAVLSYTFAEPFEVEEGEEIKVSFHAEDGLTTTAYQMGRQCCLRVVAKDPAAPGGMLGDQGGYGSASDATQRSWVAKHTWRMQVGVFAPAEHVADAVKHLTAEERAGITELLAKKDALLALLA